MALPSFENVLLDRTGTDDRIGRITLNRPEKMNALSQELIYDFRDALEYFEADDDVRVLIVKGAGRTFSAGYDLTPPGGYGADAVHRKFRTVDEDGNRLIMGIRGGMARVTDIWLYFWNMQKVTIAQLHGYAIAGGFELSMMADLVVAADDTQIGHPGLRFAGSRTSAILPLLTNMRKAKELFYTGDPIRATEAAELNLIQLRRAQGGAGRENPRPRRAHLQPARRPPRPAQGPRQPLLREHGHLLLAALLDRPRRRRHLHQPALRVVPQNARRRPQRRPGLARRPLRRLLPSPRNR